MARKACIALLLLAACACMARVAVATAEEEYDEDGYLYQPAPEGNYPEFCEDYEPCTWDYKKLVLGCECTVPCKKIKPTINQEYGLDKNGNIAYPKGEYPDEDEECKVYRYVSLKKCPSGVVYWNEKRMTLTCWRNPPSEYEPYSYVYKKPTKPQKNWHSGHTKNPITKDDKYKPKPKASYKD